MSCNCKKKQNLGYLKPQAGNPKKHININSGNTVHKVTVFGNGTEKKNK